MVTILPSEDCVFKLDSKYGFNHAANLPVTYTDVTLDDRGFGFNGSSAFIDCGNDSKFNITSEITLEAWVKLNNTSIIRLIVGKGSETSNNRSFYFYLWNTGVPVFYISSDGGGANKGYRLGTIIIDDNILHHIVGVYDGSVMNVYLDGVIDNGGLAGSIPSSIFNSSDDMYIGKRNFTTNGYINGIIKHVSVYNRALTAQEVADRYNKYTFGGHL